MENAGGTALDRQLGAAKRNVFLLASAQAVLGSAAPLSISVGALAGYQLLGADKSLATAPVTGFNVGTALGAVGIAILSRFLGRQAAFMVGALLGAVGGGLATAALFQMNFWLFAIALMLIGMSGGFTQKIRFAAADASPLTLSRRPFRGSWALASCQQSSGRNWQSGRRISSRR